MTHTKTNVVQYNEYYPFGLQTENSWTRENSSNKFLYNAGSELNANTGWYETFFRGYDAALGRFHQVDPLAGALASYSPYNFALNNPVYYNDPMGDYVEPILRPELPPTSAFDRLGAGGQGGFDNIVSELFGSEVVPGHMGPMPGYTGTVYIDIGGYTLEIDWSKVGSDGVSFNFVDNGIVVGDINLAEGNDGFWIDFPYGPGKGDIVSQSYKSIYVKGAKSPVFAQGDPRPTLRGPGNFYRDQMGTEAGKDMFERYWLGSGDMVLSKAQFDEIVKLAKLKGADSMIGTATIYNGQPATAKVISFYGTAHANSLGSATIYYDANGNAIGFYDYFNFDPKPWGVRPFAAEVKTRLVNGDGKLFGAKPFKITYP